MTGHSTIGSRVRAERVSRSVTQGELAASAGLSRKTVQRIEAGLPSATSTLRAVEDALAMREGWITPSSDVDEALGLARIGRRFRELRLAAGFTLADVAGYMGVSVSLVSRFERGHVAARKFIVLHGAGDPTSTEYEVRPGPHLARLFNLRGHEELERVLLR